MNTPSGYLALLLHAHLPFVRHPENDRHLEEVWLFEAITETYLPLLRMLQTLDRDGIRARLTFSVSPTLSAMLMDPLLRSRYARHLESLVELAEKETHRTVWLGPLHEVALFYLEHFRQLQGLYRDVGGDIPAALAGWERQGLIELITTSATHAVLPLLQDHPPSLRAQLLTAQTSHCACFGREARGIWLPECAFFPGLERHLADAGFQWFILDSHGLLHATPRPRCATFAPVLTPSGVAAFGRDHSSARQVWSRQEGYPGDVRYRDFFRDAGFDLEFEHVRPHFGSPDARTFTGIKYHRITGQGSEKEPYDRTSALKAAEEHAAHFTSSRLVELKAATTHMERPALALAPYDAELFGHWWFEGPEFLERVFRSAPVSRRAIEVITPSDYLERHPVNQHALPAASTWGEGGHLRMWLNERTEFMFRELGPAQRLMTELALQHQGARSNTTCRALAQAGRELLLAQSSDWSFIVSSGTSPEYARSRFDAHLRRFGRLAGQLMAGAVDKAALSEMEQRDNIFPGLDWSQWA